MRTKRFTQVKGDWVSAITTSVDTYSITALETKANIFSELAPEKEDSALAVICVVKAVMLPLKRKPQKW